LLPFVAYCCDFVSVVDSFLTDTPVPSGLDESVLTSTLRELLLDSVVAAGAGAGVAAGAAAAAVGGACWQPMRVRPKAVRAKAARRLQEFSFICVSLFLVLAVFDQAGVWPF
jgi:hypothetical protein